MDNDLYRVVVDWAPAYELATSLRAFLAKSEQRTMDLGRSWAREVRDRLSPALLAELEENRTIYDVGELDLLISQAPGERTANEFLDWLAALEVGDLYQRVACICSDIPRDLPTLRDGYVHVLRRWNQEYFSRLDPNILSGLAADAAAARSIVAAGPALEAVEAITNGIDYQPDPLPREVMLIPQYHFSPWNLFARAEGRDVIYYSAEFAPSSVREPPAALVRLAAALSDPSRLRILRYLSGAAHTFSDVVRYTGLAKSTVNHHLVILRAAGLVRVHGAPGVSTYSLRPAGVNRMGDLLNTFLRAPEEAEE